MNGPRYRHECEPGLWVVECVYHVGLGMLHHVDVQTRSRTLGVWSLETNEPLEGLVLTPGLAACLERLFPRRRGVS